MDDLVTWLRFQLDEDERVARETEGAWIPLGPSPDDHRPIAEHMRRNDPTRVLREVEAKRRILDGLDGVVGEIRHLENKIFGEWNDSPNIAEDLLLRLMATVYDDRPGYQESWRP